MTKKQKLELTWVGKDERPRLEPRILIEEPALSHHAETRSDDDIFDNIMIQGDNLLALKALESCYLNKIKCVYIDPPYNTGASFGHFQDGIEHSQWLSMMRSRLEILHSLISNDGSIFISIDDNEGHYLKVIADEIFGRQNFVSTVIWQSIYTVKNSARHLSGMHEYILLYAKNISLWQRNLLPRSAELDSSYTNPDNDPRGPWTTNAIQARNYYSQGSYDICSPSGQIFRPPTGTYWRVSEETFMKLDEDKRIWWGRNGNNVPRVKKFLSEAKQGVVPATLWTHDEVGQYAEAKAEIRAIAQASDIDIFDSPKPERLIKRIIEIATNPGDIVLDSFGGSGTTGAVAHKMRRRWIMVELGEHAVTHCVPRLKKVIAGEDPGGVTGAVRWKGGGGFRFCRLAPSLLTKDRFGNWVIAPGYNAAMLAEAVCKLMGFTYAPSQEPEEYWRHGHSTETDFIYVTTQSLTHDALKKLSDEVGPRRTLLVCCKAFNTRENAFDNLTIKKIPQTVLAKCEWGRDDYSLRITSLPSAETVSENEPENSAAVVTPKRGGRPRKEVATAPLFDAADDLGDEEV